jgi:hypothetical protein
MVSEYAVRAPPPVSARKPLKLSPAAPSGRRSINGILWVVS